VGDNAYGVVSADFDQDGRADVAVTSYWAMASRVLHGTGNGDLLEAAVLTAAGAPQPARPRDRRLRSRWRADLAVPSLGTNTVTVRLNRSDPAPAGLPESPRGCTPPTAGRIALWRAEDGPRDSVGTHDGTMENGAGFRDGRIGRAFGLPGDDDYVHVPDRPDLDGAGDLTLDTWMKIDDVHFGEVNPTGVAATA